MKEHSESPKDSSQKPGGGNPSTTGATAKKPVERPGAQVPPAPTPKIDVWTALEVLVRRWDWLFLGAIITGALCFYLGYSLIKPKFTASAQLLRYETPGASEFFRTTPMTPETFSGLLRSPDLMQKVGGAAMPTISAEKLNKLIKIDPQPDSDLVKVSFPAANASEAVDLLNAYVNQAVEFTRNMQKAEAQRVAHEYLKEQVEKMKGDSKSLEDQLTQLHAPAQLTNKLGQIGSDLNALGTNLAAPRSSAILTAKLQERLETSLAEYNDLLLKYTEIHPVILNKKDEIDRLKKQLAQASTNSLPPYAVANLLSSSSNGSRNPDQNDPKADILRMRLLAVCEGEVNLLNKQREAEMYVTNPPGMASVFAPASLKTVQSNMRWIKISALSGFGCFLGIFASLALVMLVEFTDTRLHNCDDVARVTRLPVLTTLGELKNMDHAARMQWGFRAWTMLQGVLSPTPNHGLVCGITSSSTGEGRSTWISLLAEAASLTGFRVLTIATKPSPMRVTTDEPFEEPLGEAGSDLKMPQLEQEKPLFAAEVPNGQMVQKNGSPDSSDANALTSPSKVTEQLTGPNSQPVVHIPLPGWVWNLDRRKQWREALNQWREIDNLVILVELPPAGVAEAVLLGSNLPNLVWLTHSGKANASNTRTQLETLRHAKCNLVGAVLNREPAIPLKKRFPRWIGCAVAAGFVIFSSNGLGDGASTAAGQSPPVSSSDNITAGGLAAHSRAAATTETDPDNTPSAGSFSVVKPAQRAEWQKHLTLGPADVVNIGLFMAPELTRNEVSISPDGRVSYLEAQDILATGLTIDELRNKLDQELSKYRRNPRTIITPVSFKSKRYYILGKIMTKGVYVLDRPMTVLEAIARAHGLENALLDRNIIDLADLQHAFLARGGRQYPLNFEHLFERGDLSQNIPIEPGDYIYLPATSAKEVYVVGEVRLPGATIWNPDMTVMAAIAARGGYTVRGYKARVVVVRGSVSNSQKILVDTHAILDGKERDFKLEPRDIVYINSRPFIRVEEVADLAATAFIQSIVTEFVGTRIIKPIAQ
jgi:protein involved in polysaccharide export with SLBB domain/capsular polysaccharide biosynthesis protein